MARASAAAFRPIRKLTVAGSIIDQVKALLRTRRAGANSELPSERDLARTLGVSRHSVREALQTLSHMGLVDVRHGSGAKLASSSSKLLKAPLELLLLFDKPSSEELLETREALEVYLAGRAAERRNAEDLAAIEAALRGMEEASGDLDALIAADVRFHEAVAQASHNRILTRVFSSLHEQIRNFMEETLPGVRDFKRLVARHRAIFEGIRRRDAAGVRREMADAMAESWRELRRTRGRR